MCGIVGFYKKNEVNIDINTLTAYLNKRGPNASGVYSNTFVSLGHARLSIIDLTTGQQPMFSDDKQVVIVFNGEIYNFKELRNSLVYLGQHFNTLSDTEVIIKGYQQWGIDELLNKLEGMFAFTIWDEKLNKLFIARDKFGEKPLFYYENENGLFFASELKALEPTLNNKEISLDALNLYFSLTYIPAPLTIYNQVYKLEPGHYLSIDSSNVVSKKQFYNLKNIVENNQNNQIEDYTEAQRLLKELLFDSVEKRMVSDVPLGSFLSGGIDSSIISAIMAKISSTPINTFSIGFTEKAYDESERAQLMAKHIKANHTQHMLSVEELLTYTNEIIDYFDEPFGDSSAIPSYMVAKKAREKVTVVLTGDCADELFGGYEKYLGNYYAEKLNNYPNILKNIVTKTINTIPHNSFTNHTLRKVKKVITSAELTDSNRYLNLTSLGYNETEKQKLLSKQLYTNSSLESLKYYNQLNIDNQLIKTFYSDVNLVLEGDMLPKVDRMCMINSLEARVPFLDSKIVDFSFKLLNEFKINGTNKKRILKDTFGYLLPKETLSFSKKGFGIPIRIWFKNELKSELLSLLEKDFIIAQNIFNPDYIEQLVNEHMSNKENHSTKLWLLFVFQKWYKLHA